MLLLYLYLCVALSQQTGRTAVIKVLLSGADLGAAGALYKTTRRRFLDGRLSFIDSSTFSGFSNGVAE